MQPDNAPPLKILAISGSLRRASLNSALLRVMADRAPRRMAFTLFSGAGDLPLFNPDLEASIPPAVAALHDAVAVADALVIASPEYAHGVTGVIKNLLDWLVSFEPFVCKPVAVLNASPRAHHADAALRETLRTMSADIVEEASLTFPLVGSGIDERGMAASPEIGALIDRVLAELEKGVLARHTRVA